MADILLAEDNAAFRDELADTLRDEGHAVRTAPDGAAALADFARRRPDLLLLDVMMPGLSGYDVCEAVRRTDALVPILMLTAKNAENDRVRGLRRGADDYIDKTVGARELLARIDAALRRASAQPPPAVPPAPPSAFAIGAHTVDAARLKIRDARGRETDLTPQEMKVLALLVAEPGRVFSREDFIARLWNGVYAGTTRSIDQTVWRLRQKLGRDGARIATVHGAGYRLVKGER